MRIAGRERSLLPRSLSARLAMVVAAGTSVVLVICLMLLYVALDRQLRSALDTDLVERSRDLQSSLAAGDTSALMRDPLAQLYDPQGDLIAGSTALGTRRILPVPRVERISQDSTDTFQNLTVPFGPGDTDLSVRLFSRPVENDQVLTVGVSEAPVVAARDRLLLVVFVATPLLIGLLAVVGWLVVRFALRPVDLLTREAQAISSLDTDQRLPAVPGDDEIARLARTLDDMLARLRVAFDRERAFVDDASHELRTPIAILRGELDLAVSAATSPEEEERAEVARSLSAAVRETARLSRLADDLLLLARERAGTLLLTREPVDLLDLVRDEARRLESVLGLRIEVGGDPVVVEGDPERLCQVFANLAGNSATAGAHRLRIHLTGSSDVVVVESADDGPGFSPRVLDSAFERFVRGDEARTRGASGAGLGLSIVRAVVAAHGGIVDARNGAPLGGAVVTARLPVS